MAAIEEQVAAAAAADDLGLAVAFLSTPSLFFAVSPAVRARSRLLDLDKQWESSGPNFVRYDFNRPEALPMDFHGKFQMVVMDPPFITREVWELYARAARLLVVRGGRPRPSILATTVQENAGIMAELFGAREQRFKPMVPNLVYQFSLFTTFESPRLALPNPEVEEDG